jgi:hypothetical protein
VTVAVRQDQKEFHLGEICHDAPSAKATASKRALPTASDQHRDHLLQLAATSAQPQPSSSSKRDGVIDSQYQKLRIRPDNR